MSIVFQDDVTPLNAVNMNKLEQVSRKAAANGYASLDAGSKVPLAQLPDLSGTYQPLSQKNAASGYPGLDGAGDLALTAAQKIKWAGDTTLYRAAANRLETPNLLTVGGLELSATDVTLYKGAASRADTNASLNILYGQRLMFDSDTSLYRLSATALKTNVGFRATYDLYAREAGAAQVYLGDPGDGKASVSFGSALDARLYREAANYLKTDNHLIVTGNIQGAAGPSGGVSLMMRTAHFLSFEWDGTNIKFFVDNTHVKTLTTL